MSERTVSTWKFCIFLVSYPVADQSVYNLLWNLEIILCNYANRFMYKIIYFIFVLKSGQSTGHIWLECMDDGASSEYVKYNDVNKAKRAVV